METDHEKKSRRIRLAVACALSLTLIITLTVAAVRTNARTASKTRETVEENCVLLQTLHYSRCGHEVTRRVPADKEYKGCTLQQMQEAYPDWSITSFSPAEIVMSCTLPLYCPDHLVVMPDGAGVLGIYENVYGDGYALRSQLDIPLGVLPEETRETVHLGIGFSNEQDIERWLETFES